MFFVVLARAEEEVVPVWDSSLQETIKSRLMLSNRSKEFFIVLGLAHEI